MKRLLPPLVLLCLVCATSSCDPEQTTETVPSPDNDYGELVAGIVKLHADANADWPKHLNADDAVRTGTEFDPNAYFTVLTHLSMADELVLDYVYRFIGGNGRPFLYVRDKSAERYKTYKEYEDALGGEKAVREAEKAVYENVKTDGAAEGFFELALLYELGGQFYLSWHDNYRRSLVVLTPDDVAAIVADHDVRHFGRAFTDDEKEAMKGIVVQPRVEFGDDGQVTVSVVSFNDWHGFVRRTYHFQRDFPHKLANVEVETLVEYDCGIRF
jgi:hypothetical protein